MSGDATSREVERQLAVMRENAVELYGEEDLRRRLGVALREGRPLRVKLGLDPSSPDLRFSSSSEAASSSRAGR